MNNIDVRDKRVLVMGLGVNQGGLGVSKWLLTNGAKLTVTDLKDRHALADSIAALEKHRKTLMKRGRRVPAVRYVLGRHDAADFRRADVVIQNPGVPRESPYLKMARKAGAAVESDISIFFRLCPHPIIGISGTKGKTTTTAMAAAILKEAFGRVVVGGNIRRSPLDALDGLMKAKKAPPIVLELSSWQLESLRACKRSPEIAVLTNVMPDHLNRYDGMADYAAAKELIYRWQEKGDQAIVPHDNAYTRKMGARVPASRVWASPAFFECDENILAYRRDGRAVIRKDGVETELFLALDLRVDGAHNRWNALLAAGACFLRGAKPSAIRRALRAFRGVPHRTEFVKRVDGVEYWNDTAATTPEASIAALETLADGKNVVLIAGGADKKLEFPAWAKEAKRHCRDIILLDGTATPKMLKALKKEGVPVGAVVGSMEEAVRHASRAAGLGDVVLLSPGCASFGIFINEFERGDRFKKAVSRL